MRSKLLTIFFRFSRKRQNPSQKSLQRHLHRLIILHDVIYVFTHAQMVPYETLQQLDMIVSFLVSIRCLKIYKNWSLNHKTGKPGERGTLFPLILFNSTRYCPVFVPLCAYQAWASRWRRLAEIFPCTYCSWSKNPSFLMRSRRYIRNVSSCLWEEFSWVYVPLYFSLWEGVLIRSLCIVSCRICAYFWTVSQEVGINLS